jgi:hypothetical protein
MRAVEDDYVLRHFSCAWTRLLSPATTAVGAGLENGNTEEEVDTESSYI